MKYKPLNMFTKQTDELKELYCDYLDNNSKNRYNEAIRKDSLL